MACYVGVDIGLDGGLGVLQDGEQPLVVRMPTITLEVKGKKKREVDFEKLRRIFVALMTKHGGDVFVLLEKPQLRPAIIRDSESGELKPNQGIVSQVKFMSQWSEFRGLLRGLGIAQDDVHPATWKADVFRGQGGRGKDASRLKASQLFPTIATAFKNKNSDGVAEAMLLADYARRRRSSPF